MEKYNDSKTGQESSQEENKIEKTGVVQIIRAALFGNLYQDSFILCQNHYIVPLLVNLLVIVLLLAAFAYYAKKGIRLTNTNIVLGPIALLFTRNLLGFFREMRYHRQNPEPTRKERSEIRGGYSRTENIIIPFGAQKIDDLAYYDYKKLKQVEIPETVYIIGERAFEYCEELSQIIIPETVCEIGGYAFSRCFKLQELIIPSTITEIREGLFEYCSGLMTVEIPDSVKRIGDHAFSHCSSLKRIIIPPSVEEIGKEAFAFSGLEELVLPETVQMIGENAFKGCRDLEKLQIQTKSGVIGKNVFEDCISLEKVCFSYGVKDIPSHLFCCCFRLKNIVLPDGVEHIGSCAFAKSGLMEIVIPGSVKSIAFNAFFCCNDMASLTFVGTEADWKKVKKVHDSILLFDLRSKERIHFTDASHT